MDVLAALDNVGRKRPTEEMMEEGVLSSIKTLMNTKLGLEQLMANRDGIATIAYSLDTGNTNIKARGGAVVAVVAVLRCCGVA